MSSRALKRLQDQKALDNLNAELNEEENSEEASEVVAVKASKKNKKKQRANLFHLLADEEDLENEENDEAIISDDEESQSVTTTSDQTVTQSVKKKSSKKKKKKKTNKKKNDEDDNDDTEQLDDPELDEIDRANLMLGLTPRTYDVTDGCTAGQPFRNKSLLSIDYRNLNPTNEMKRRFGSAVVDTERRRNPHERKFKKTTRLVTPKDNWPPYSKVGITMAKDESDNNGGSSSFLFTFEHQELYQKLQYKFYDAVESMDHNNIVALLNAYPYHIDSLLQLSEVCRHNEDVQMASELIERALYVFECNFHTLFNTALGTCRVNYKRSESRPFFLALFRHIKYIGDRACYRTALEFCKLLLGLDPDEDPLCVLLIIDYFAIKAEEYEYLIELHNEYEVIKNVSLLPNFAYSYALANFHLGKMDEANKAIRIALMRFPSLLVELMDKCGVSIDDSLRENTLYNPVSFLKQSPALNTLTSLYVGRSFSLWKIPEVIDWIVGASKELVDDIDVSKKNIAREKQLRETRYNRTPNNILRHVIISEVKEALQHIPLDVRKKTIMTYDPLPPEDSVTGYTRPDRPAGSQEQRNLLSLFFESMLPSFDQAENERAQRAEQNEARALPLHNEQRAGNVLRNGAEGLMNAMQELLHTMTFRNDGAERPGDENDGLHEEEDWE